MSKSSIHNCYVKAVNMVIRLCLLLCGIFTAPSLKAQIDTSQAIGMGRAALYYDDYLTAIHYFNAALEAKPYLAEAYYCRATAEFDMGDYREAEADLDLAITFNPFHIEYFQLRGLCRIHNEGYTGAIEDYSHVLEERPDDQSCRYNRALCHYELQQYEQASSEFDEIIRRWPRFARAYIVKAQTCLEMQDTVQSIFWIDSLLVLSKREPNAWSVKGRYAMQHGRYVSADSCYSQALRYDAGNIEYYMKRAQARCALGAYQQAVSDYDRIVSMEPRNVNARYNRALVYAAIGKDERALEELEMLLRYVPDLASAKELGATIKGKKKQRLFATPNDVLALLAEDNVSAERSFMEEFKGKVQSHKMERVFLPQFHVEGNHILVEGGRHPMYSSDERFLDIIRRTNIDTGIKPQEAIRLIKEYQEITFDDAVIFYNLGCLEIEGGSFEAAEAYFNKAIELDPLMPEVYYNKAVIYLLQNNNGVAYPLLSKAGEMGIVKAYNLLNQSKIK